MSKSEGQKMKLFALKEILEQETDANHGITMARILELLSMRGIKAERKSIYDDIRAFRESEYLDVTVPQGQKQKAESREQFSFPHEPQQKCGAGWNLRIGIVSLSICFL